MAEEVSFVGREWIFFFISEIFLPSLLCLSLCLKLFVLDEPKLKQSSSFHIP